MSVIVGIKQDGKIYLGADSQITKGGTRLSLTNPNNYKIWKVIGEENCLMGCVGSLREACVVRIISDFIKKTDDGDNTIDFECVVARIVPKIKAELEYYDYLDKDKVFDGFDSSYLFAHKDKLFFINSDGAVIEIDDCIAIGSGANESIGSLVTSIGEDPVERIIKAIKASAVHDIYVDYPIIITDTATTEFKIIDM